MNLFFKYSITFLIFLQTFIVKSQIPLPEHPRPDFQRQMWENLNGQWDFKFDQNNIGEKENIFCIKIPISNAIDIRFSTNNFSNDLFNKSIIMSYKIK